MHLSALPTQRRHETLGQLVDSLAQKWTGNKKVRKSLKFSLRFSFLFQHHNRVASRVKEKNQLFELQEKREGGGFNTWSQPIPSGCDHIWTVACFYFGSGGRRKNSLEDQEGHINYIPTTILILGQDSIYWPIWHTYSSESSEGMTQPPSAAISVLGRISQICRGELPE